MKNNVLLTLPFAVALGACSSSTPDAEPSSAPAAGTSASAVKAEAMTAGQAVKGSIVDVAMGAGEFGTLITALKAAGLDSVLSGEGEFTVFAPTDAAFEKLPAGTLESLLADKEQLTSVLTYHVVSGKVMAKDVAGLTSAKTVNGAALPVDTSNGVKVGKAKVTKTDIKAKNGVIHVIDTVLIPPKSM